MIQELAALPEDRQDGVDMDADMDADMDVPERLRGLSIDDPEAINETIIGQGDLLQVNWELPDSSGKTVFEYAMETGYQELIAHLKKMSAEKSYSDALEKG